MIAKAELAWPVHGIAIVLPDQEAHVPAFAAAGWQVFTENTPNPARRSSTRSPAQANVRRPTGQGER